jgi:chromosome partitioning protein
MPDRVSNRFMHNIMVLNAKGGCGKTTISTTLACYFAGQGYSTALMDYDPQNSSGHWLSMRTDEQPTIRSIDAARIRSGVTRTWQLHSGPGTDIVISDTPAGLTGGKLVDLFHKADSILIPVMPTMIDLHAVRRFLEEILRLSRHNLKGKHIALVANRVRFKTDSYQQLEELAAELEIPLIGSLRDTRNYTIAMESGKGICEMDQRATGKDRKQWQPIINWLSERMPSRAAESVDSVSRSAWESGKLAGAALS